MLHSYNRKLGISKIFSSVRYTHLRVLSKVTLVLLSVSLLIAILWLLVFPIVQYDEGMESKWFFIDNTFDRGMSTGFNIRIEDSVPFATVYLASIGLRQPVPIEQCPKSLVVATGQSLMLPYESIVGDPASSTNSDAMGYLTLYEQVPTTTTSRFADSIKSEMGSQLTNSNIPGFTDRCNQISSDTKTQSSISLSGAESLNVQELPVVARTLGNIVRPTYFYPFDQYELLISAILSTQTRPKINFASSVTDFQQTALYRPDTPSAVAPDISLLISAPSWQMKTERVRANSGQIDYPAVVFQRSLATRTLFVVLLSVVATVISIVPFVQEKSSVLEISVAILFSLWGIRSILLPSYIEQTTILEHIILCLYLLLAFTILLRFAIIPLWTRLDASRVDQLPTKGEQVLTDIQDDSHNSKLRKVSNRYGKK